MIIEEKKKERKFNYKDKRRMKESVESGVAMRQKTENAT